MGEQNQIENEDYADIVDWEVLYQNSEKFKKSKPFKHGFVKGIFKKEFYDKLYKSFPKEDNSWFVNNDYRRTARTKQFLGYQEKPKAVKDLSPEWNKLQVYITTKEFSDNFSKYTGIKLKGPHEAGFFANKKNDFQLPHIDVDGEYINTIQLLFYFSKGWEKGEPGGTYLAKTDDEETIFFEPYDLDNTMICFVEGKHSWHGTRYIVKDVVRQALSVSLM